MRRGYGKSDLTRREPSLDREPSPSLDSFPMTKFPSCRKILLICSLVFTAGGVVTRAAEAVKPNIILIIHG